MLSVLESCLLAAQKAVVNPQASNKRQAGTISCAGKWNGMCTPGQTTGFSLCSPIPPQNKTTETPQSMADMFDKLL